MTSGRQGALARRCAPWRSPRSARAALPGEAGELRDVGDGGEAGRRVRGDVVSYGKTRT